MFGLPFPKAGLLGMNRRNAEYILERNPRKYYPLVDDKLKTKQLLERHGLPVPPLYFEINYEFELKMLREIRHLREFVIKPVRGAAGRGILVIVGRQGHLWKKANGKLLSIDDIEYHLTNILAGLYSLGGTDDQAFIEYFVRSHPAFRHLAGQGVPDIRIVLYRGVPVMSMLRLPTQQSDGKANLHQGAAGAGIDMSKGVTLGAVHKNRLIDMHPDSGLPVAGLHIPFWDTIVETSVKISEIFKLGYMGVDFVIDSLLGPLILELNARPGLNIQLANRTGLLPRLKAVDRWGPDVEKFPASKRLEIMHQVTLL